MASVNLMKLHGSEAGAVLAHSFRHDGRPVRYGNEHIDPAKSGDNGTLVYRGVHAQDGRARDAYARLKARVEEIDKAEPPKRIRRDRVTMVAFEVPAPEGLPPERERQFFKIAYAEIARMCGGAQNVSPLKIHRDEVHDYIDPVTKDVKTSRVHAHVVGIPYVKGKGVNCKQFMTRQALRDLQKRIDDRCRSDLGVRFMDGSRQRSRGTVEDLKRYSAAAVAAQEAQDTAIWAQSATEDAEHLKHQLDRIADQVDHARRRAALQGDLAAWLSRKHPEVVEEYDRYVDRTASMIEKVRRGIDDLDR